MCAFALLILLNALQKSDKMLSTPHILSIFSNSFLKLKKQQHEHSCKILYVLQERIYAPLIVMHVER